MKLVSSEDYEAIENVNRRNNGEINMKEVNIFELEKVKNDSACFYLAKQFRDYVTIRRNLREADQICSYAIECRKFFLSDKQNLKQIEGSLFLVSRY